MSVRSLFANLLRWIIIQLRRGRTRYYTYWAKKQLGSYDGLIRVNYKSKFTRNTYVKENVHFNGMTIKGCGDVYIGRNFHSGVQCLMLTQNHNYEGSSLPYDNTYICKNIHIGDNVWLGDHVMVLGGVKIGEGAIIQAGSVVVNDIPKCAIAGGHPAKVFSTRNVFHYEELKRKKSFI